MLRAPTSFLFCALSCDSTPCLVITCKFITKFEKSGVGFGKISVLAFRDGDGDFWCVWSRTWLGNILGQSVASVDTELFKGFGRFCCSHLPLNLHIL